LKGRAIPTESDKPQGEVISQSPSAGLSVKQGSQVKLKVSKGPKPVAVPNVVGSTFESANSILLGAGFAVLRREVQSDEPKDTVVDTSPGVGTLQPPRTTITVMVSKGPTTSTVPDVTTLTQSDAQATLKASGFGVKIVSQPVTDQSQDGVVQTQDPPGGSQQPPATIVTIAVGKFAGTGPPP
jgi:eukaryotic-like serine/threonine-protein kinase